MINRLWPILMLCLILPLTGCAGRYFDKAGPEPKRPVQYDFASLPHHELWMGLVFNGNKIGFSHLTITPAADIPDAYEINSEAVFAFRFMLYDKKINLKSYDLVNADLTLRRLSYEYNLDGNIQQMEGNVDGDQLTVAITANNETSVVTHPTGGKIYPASGTGLLPVLQGLATGRTFEYPVYNGETQTVEQVKQEILAFETSQLFTGQAYKLRTEMQDQEVMTWIDVEGRPQLELSLGGVIISYLESEREARQYLAEAAINKNETFLALSLIKPSEPIANPRQVSSLEVILTGMKPSMTLPNDGRQQCERTADGARCLIRTDTYIEKPVSRDEELARIKALLPTHIVPSKNEQIVAQASGIVGDEQDPASQVRLLIEWLQENIEPAGVDAFTALDVLKNRRAECQGHSYLFAALARALNIPAKVVNGIAYSEDYEGFLYHTWVEGLLDGQWLAIDPTFGQIPADATHIKLVEGEGLSEVTPLVELIGKLGVEIVSIRVLSGTE